MVLSSLSLSIISYLGLGLVLGIKLVLDLGLGSVCINLMIQLSHIPGHEIRIVSYALWDGGDCLLY